MGMSNLGQFRENLMFLSVTAALEFESKILFHISDTYRCNLLPHTTFLMITYIQILLHNLAAFTVKSPALLTENNLKNMLLNRVKPIALFSQTVGSNNPFT